MHWWGGGGGELLVLAEGSKSRKGAFFLQAVVPPLTGLAAIPDLGLVFLDSPCRDPEAGRDEGCLLKHPEESVLAAVTHVLSQHGVD